MTESRTIWMLIALAAATFVITASGPSTAPFLQIIAIDLSTDLAAVAHLFSVQALTWGAAALLAGALSDRVGRRAILAAGVALLGLTRLGFAASQSYASALAWQVVSGLGGGAFMGAVFATVADHVGPELRGRALSWVITGQSLALVLGVPIVALLGSAGGWRGAIAAHGAATIAAALAVRMVVPPDLARTHHARSKASLKSLLRPRLFALLAAGTTERLCFATLAIYLPTYLQRAYAVSLGGLALALALVALGNLAGTIVGGRIADRTRSRTRLFAVASALTSVLALPTLMWQPGLAISVVLGFAYSLVGAAGRPALMATLSEVPSELRGALLGLNITMASMGWLLAGSAGAWLIATGGFDAIAAFCSMVALAGAALALKGSVRTR